MATRRNGVGGWRPLLPAVAEWDHVLQLVPLGSEALAMIGKIRILQFRSLYGAVARKFSLIFKTMIAFLI